MSLLLLRKLLFYVLEITSILMLLEITKNQNGAIGIVKYDSQVPTLYSNMNPAVLCRKP